MAVARQVIYLHLDSASERYPCIQPKLADRGIGVDGQSWDGTLRVDTQKDAHWMASAVRATIRRIRHRQTNRISTGCGIGMIGILRST